MKFRVYISIGFIILLCAGCAARPFIAPPRPPDMPGIYHRVKRGQTLWRLAKIYNVDLAQLVEINRIANATHIEAGQLIFIPHGQKPQPYHHSKEDFIWPLRGEVISTFGQTFDNMINKGINIKPQGKHNIVAVRSGKVIFYSPDFEGFGKTIIIDHGDRISAVYARNSQVFVKAGDNIQKGSIIAKAGSYLHFQIRKGHIPQNPYFYLPH